MGTLGLEMANLSEFKQYHTALPVLQGAESIHHFDALKQLLLLHGIYSQELSDFALEQRKQRRVLSSDLKSNGHHQYFVQLAKVETHPTQIFAPLISAALNRATLYIAAEDRLMHDIYRHYFNIEATQLEKQRALAEMHLSFDFLPQSLNNQQLVVYALSKALLDENCQQIYLLGEHTISEPLLSEFTAQTGILIYEVNVTAREEESIDFRTLELNKLFWKNKSEHLTQACQAIAQENAVLVGLQMGIDQRHARHLIDDLLYGEHIFEKMSVFGEFTETILKHHLEIRRKTEQIT